MSPFAKGWRPNPPGEYPHAKHLVAARMGAVPTGGASLRDYRGIHRLQYQAGSCVAFSISRLLQLFYAANGIGADIWAAPLFTYWTGRREEFASEVPEQIGPAWDSGMVPAVATRAVQLEGFVLESDYPYTDAPEVLNAEPPPHVFQQAYEQRGLQHGVIPDDEEKCPLIAQAMELRLPAMFALQIDAAFEENNGNTIESIDHGQIVGGHMLAVLAVTPDEVIFDNWWPGWGDSDGIGRMSRVCFEKEARDVTIFQAVPPVRKAR